MQMAALLILSCIGGGGGGGGGVCVDNPFQSNFGTTKDTSQNFNLLTKCLKNTQRVYSRTGAR